MGCIFLLLSIMLGGLTGAHMNMKNLFLELILKVAAPSMYNYELQIDHVIQNLQVNFSKVQN